MGKIRLYALRCTFVFNTCLLTHLLLRSTRLESDVEGDDGSCNVARWTDIDVFHPPPARNALQEAVRLNELLAHSQYRCSASLRIPEHSQLPSAICTRPDPLGLDLGDGATVVFVLNGASELGFEQDFRRRYPGARIWVLASPDSRVGRRWAELKRDPKATLDESGNPGALGKLLRRLESVQLLRLDCVDCEDPGHLPEWLSGLIREGLLGKVQQLHINAHIPDLKEQELIFSWYSVFQDLFFSSHLAIFSAAQSGLCGRAMAQCQYRLSLVRLPSNGSVSVDPPVSGMATPDEEFGRLFAYMSQARDPSLCPTPTLLNVGCTGWTLCGDASAPPCVFYLFRLPTGDAPSTEAELKRCGVHFKTCSVHIFDPTLPRSAEFYNIRLHDYTISDSQKEYMGPGLSPSAKQWHLRPLPALIRDLHHADQPLSALLLDLQGWELSLLEEALRSGAWAAQFRSVVIRWPLFYGEEFEVEQRVFGALLRLEESGLHLAHSRLVRRAGQAGHLSTFELTFLNAKFNITRDTA